MSFEALFEDRKRRSFIRESINTAEDIGAGTCDLCESEGYILKAFNHNVCEDCCNKLLGVSEAFEVELPDIQDLMGIEEGTETNDNTGIEFLQDCVQESVIYFNDIDKMQQEADSKSGGDILRLVTDVYKCKAASVKGNKIDFFDKQQYSGKTRINRLMIDYDGEFGTEKAAMNTIADADGAFAPRKVYKKGIVTGTAPNTPPNTPKSQPTSHTKVNKQASAKSSVTTISTGAISGDLNHAEFEMGGIRVTLSQIGNGTGPSMGVSQYEVTFLKVKELLSFKDINSLDALVKATKEQFANEPQKFFSSFEGISDGVYGLTKYDIYSFQLDELSFEKEITITPVYGGKRFPKERIRISARALMNKVLLTEELNAYIDQKVDDKYPMLGDGKNVFKTSIGNAVFTLKNIVDKDTIDIEVDWCGKLLEFKEKGVVFAEESKAKKRFADFLFENFKSVFVSMTQPEWKNGTQCVLYPVYGSDGEAFKITGVIDVKEFEKSGDISVLASIEAHGNKYPNKGNGYQEYKVSKYGIDLTSFVLKCGQELYDTYEAATTMTDTMKDSAIKKMSNPSKKVALLSKIGLKIKEVLDDLKVMNNNQPYVDFSVDLDMKVNKDGKVVSAMVKVLDEDEISDATKLKDLADKFAKGVKWLKFVRLGKDGEDTYMLFNVTNIEAFSQTIHLNVFENAIMEAFEVSKSRKTIMVEE